MRWNANHILPVLLLLGGCGGLGLGNVSDEPQLPSAPRRAVAADADPAWQHREQPGAPGAAYAQPAGQTPAPAQDQPGGEETYRTADGRVHTLPRRGGGKVARPALDRPPVAPADNDAPPTAPPRPAPLQASSQQVPGEERYDTVGYAGVRSVAASGAAAQSVVAVHGALPAGTIVEVTSLDTGRTILVLVTATMEVPPDHVIDLSPAAAQALGGTGEPIPVRVRTVYATAQDQALLRSGQAASERIDAPPALVSGLRRRLGAPPLASQPQPVAQQPLRPKPPVAAQPVRSARPAPGASYAPPSRPAPRAPAPVAAAGSYFVQVAALSAVDRAQSLARSLGGTVRAGGGLYRVQLGPYANAADAGRAKASARARGYGDAVIVRLP